MQGAFFCQFYSQLLYLGVCCFDILFSVCYFSMLFSACFLGMLFFICLPDILFSLSIWVYYIYFYSFTPDLLLLKLPQGYIWTNPLFLPLLSYYIWVKLAFLFFIPSQWQIQTLMKGIIHIFSCIYPKQACFP